MTTLPRHPKASILVLFGAWFGLNAAAMAADIAPMPTKAVILPPPAVNAWTFSITPYGWLPLLRGSTTVKGRTADVNVDFNDLMSLVRNSEIPKDLLALMGYFEARNGRFSVFADLVYLKVGLDGSMARSRGTDEINATVGASAGLKTEMFIGEVAAAYEIGKLPGAAALGAGTAIDVFAGARGWHQSANLNLALSGTVNVGDLSRNADRTLTASKDVSWVDPLVGLRLRHQFAPGWNFVASGDIGGFGVGSKFSWQAVAALNYDFYVHNNVTWSGVVGYKALYVDYSQGSGLSHYEYNMTMHGPVFGVTARF